VQIKRSNDASYADNIHNRRYIAKRAGRRPQQIFEGTSSDSCPTDAYVLFLVWSTVLATLRPVRAAHDDFLIRSERWWWWDEVCLVALHTTSFMGPRNARSDDSD
jgi:hypothetical protein